MNRHFAMIACLKNEKNNYKTYTLREHAYGITDNCVFALFFHKLKWKHQIIQS